MWELTDYSGNDDERLLPLLLSERSQQLVLAALQNMDLRWLWNADDDAVWDDIEEVVGNAYLEIIEEQMPDFTPVGTITSYCGIESSIPEKWLKCNGASMLQSFYPELAAILPESMKSGDLMTLPDLSYRYIRQAQDDSDLGDFIGSDTHALTVSEMPAHSHTVGTIAGAGNNNSSVQKGNGSPTNTIATSSQGSGVAHNNMPSSQMFYAIIKALP